MNYVSKVLKVAFDEVGYLEKKTNSKLDSKTDNAGYNNFTKYGRDLSAAIGSPYSNGVAWCDTFVDWCFVKAFGISEAKKLLGGWSAYTPTSASYYKAAFRYYKKNPQIGDQIFFKNANGVICHTGLVYDVDSSKVYTIEGNTSSGCGVVANGGGVFKKSYSLSYSRIDGYGRPKYDVEPVEGWQKNTIGWWYRYKDGSYPVLCWKRIDGKDYYFDASGYMASDEYIKSSNYSQDGKLYYVAKDGAWDGKSYKWMSNDKGWWITDGSWYPKNSWAKIAGKWYYFDDKGYMVTGTRTIDGKIYNFNKNGRGF